MRPSVSRCSALALPRALSGTAPPYAERPNEDDDPETTWLDSPLFSAGLRDIPAEEGGGGSSPGPAALAYPYTALRPAVAVPIPPGAIGGTLEPPLHPRHRHHAAGVPQFSQLDDQICELLAAGTGDGALLWDAVKRDARLEVCVCVSVCVCVAVRSAYGGGRTLHERCGPPAAILTACLVYYRKASSRPWS